AAGVVLSLLVLKPQLALLVPVALLAAGYRKTFASWLVASAVIGVFALVMLGGDGVARYRDVLAQTQTAAWDITRRYSISGPLGLGWALRVAELAVLVVLAIPILLAELLLLGTLLWPFRTVGANEALGTMSKRLAASKGA